MSRTLFTNTVVFDGTGSDPRPADVTVADGRIVDVGLGLDGDVAIDLDGAALLPGLFDCHAHISFLTTRGDEEARKVLKQFVASGITQVRDVGGPIDVIAGLSGSISDGELTGPEIFYTGPMLEKSPMHWSNFNKQLPGFTVALDSKEDVERILRELADKGAGLIKTFNRIKRMAWQCQSKEN